MKTIIILVCLCVVVAPFLYTYCNEKELRVRRDQATLTPVDKSKLLQTFMVLKGKGVYDKFVREFKKSAHTAENTEQFLFYNRELLHRFENEMRTHYTDMTLPYWDWTTDRSRNSKLWEEDMMGGNGKAQNNEVFTGVFSFYRRRWPIKVTSVGNVDESLQRNFGAEDEEVAQQPGANLRKLPSKELVYEIMAIPDFRKFSRRVESELNQPVHNWVGGAMDSTKTAPNDPVFWLHRAFIDFLFTSWQKTHEAAFQEFLMKEEGRDLITTKISATYSDKFVNDVLYTDSHRLLQYYYDRLLTREQAQQFRRAQQVVIDLIERVVPQNNQQRFMASTVFAVVLIVLLLCGLQVYLKKSKNHMYNPNKEISLDMDDPNGYVFSWLRRRKLHMN